MVQMSKTGLSACRSITLEDMPLSDLKKASGRNPVTVVKVRDPRLSNKVVKEIMCRQECDVTRILRAWQGTYRVPNENVFDNRKPATGPEADTDTEPSNPVGDFGKGTDG